METNQNDALQQEHLRDDTILQVRTRNYDQELIYYKELLEQPKLTIDQVKLIKIKIRALEEEKEEEKNYQSIKAF